MYSLKFVIFVLSVSAAVALPAEQGLSEGEKDWKNFQLAYKKVYKGVAEEKMRLKIFLENKMYIDKHNERYAKGEVSFDLGINKFSDLSNEEFRRLMTASVNVSDIEALKSNPRRITLSAGMRASDSLDWRHYGAVTGVKDQGPCGSCWAFTTTGAIEGQHFRKTGHLVSLSEQNLIDCSRGYGNNGCSGGWMSGAYEYIINNRGIDTEESYPYEARDSDCRFNSWGVGAIVYTYSWLWADENNVMNAVAILGPISVAIDAGQPSFQHYRSGVYNEPACTHDVNHGVLIVGYGDENHQDYWLVKNSWGTEWGEGGYIKMSRNRGNQCSIASFGNFPVV